MPVPTAYGFPHPIRYIGPRRPDNWQPVQTGTTPEYIPPEPPEPVYPGFVIYPAASGLLTTNPSSVVTPFFGSEVSYGTIPFLGALAVRPVGGSSNVNYDISATGFDLGTGDFTLETWGKVSSTSADQSWLLLLDPAANGFIARLLLGGNGTSATRRIRFSYGGNVFVNGSTTPDASIVDFNHMVIQRIGGVMHFHLNGTPLTYTEPGVPQYAYPIGSGALVQMQLSSTVGAAAFGQARLVVGQGIYGTGAFTPRTTPFLLP